MCEVGIVSGWREGDRSTLAPPGGWARASLNATRHGRAALLPALGETAVDWDAIRAAVAQDLAPVGAAETALAERIGLLLWRQRRAAMYAPAAELVDLPPDPDTAGRRGRYSRPPSGL